MMNNNKVYLRGRATQEYELKYYANNTPYIDFSLAVDNKLASKDNERSKAFFINVRVSGKTAEYLGRYGAPKGQLIVWGYLEQGSYKSQSSGQNVYYTRVVAEEVDIIDYRKKETVETQQNPFTGMGAFVPDVDEEDLPFN